MVFQKPHKAKVRRDTLDILHIIEQLMPEKPKTIAVAAAEDDVVLEAVTKAFEYGIAIPVLCGNSIKIKSIAQEKNINISKFEIIDTKNPANTAVSLVREGKADMLMKGLLHTAELLRAVLNKEKGLRGQGILSHVSILHSPILNRMFLLTDAAMVMYPDLKTKIELVRNAVTAAHGMGIGSPKVAPLAAVEVVNSDMQATIDAATLTIMNQRGQITDCVIDGPLAMDLALSEEAVRHKGINSPVAGNADILLMHNIEAANSTLKAFTVGGNCLFGGIIMGAAAPIVLASRSDSEKSKLYSIACASSICTNASRTEVGENT